MIGVGEDDTKSALLQACIKGDTKEALKLIDDPMVSIDTTDKAGRTPLIHAITHKHTFPPEEEHEYDEESDMWTKRCACGFEVQYDKW